MCINIKRDALFLGDFRTRKDIFHILNIAISHFLGRILSNLAAYFRKMSLFRDYRYMHKQQN